MSDKTIRLQHVSTPRRSNHSVERPRPPVLNEPDRRNASADRYALGALGFGLLTGASAIVALPSAYLLVSNPIVRTVVYSVPVLVPALGAACFGLRARQESRATASSTQSQVAADMQEVLDVSDHQSDHHASDAIRDARTTTQSNDDSFV